MSRKCPPPDPKLRAEAEARLADAEPATAPGRSAEELLHELQVHQIELEMQNEELRRTQVALEESRDRYVELYEFAPVGYLTLSHNGLITQANLTAAAMLGVERGKLRQRRFSLFVASEDRDRFHRLFLRAMQDGEWHVCELALQRGAGAVFHAQMDCLRVAAGTGISVAHVTFTDVSERRQAEAQRLDYARQQRDALVREVHHRIKNHLQGLVGLLRQHVQRKPELTQTVDEMVSQIHAIAEVHGLQGQLPTGEVRLAELVRGIAAFLGGLTQVSLKAASDPLCCNHAWLVNEKESVPLALVLNELMTNAIRHGGNATTAQAPQVGMACNCSAQGAVVSVSNPGDLPAGFDYTGGKGLGTGLALVRSLLPAGAALAFSATGGRIELAPPVLVAPGS